jgi:hypothetical protein
MATNAKCPLCRLEIASLTSLRRHLGKHLEELSLFALPSHLREGPNENSDEEDADDSHSLSRIAQECKSQTTSTDANRDREQSSQEYDDFAAACHRWSLRLNEEDSQWKDSIYGVPLQQAVQGDLDPTPGPNMTATHGESALENVVGKSDDFVPNTRNSNTSDKDAPSTDTPITTGGQIENDDRITVPTRQEDPVSSIGVSGKSIYHEPKLQVFLTPALLNLISNALVYTTNSFRAQYKLWNHSGYQRQFASCPWDCPNFRYIDFPPRNPALKRLRGAGRAYTIFRPAFRSSCLSMRFLAPWLRRSLCGRGRLEGAWPYALSRIPGS